MCNKICFSSSMKLQALPFFLQAISPAWHARDQWRTKHRLGAKKKGTCAYAWSKKEKRLGSWDMSIFFIETVWTVAGCKHVNCP